MDDNRFQLDPNAKFDDEIARIARENNADVAFRLVPRREDTAMPHSCATCATPTPATHVMTIQKPGLEPVRVYVCEADGKWIADGRVKPKEEPPPNMDRKLVEQLRPLMADKTVTILGTRMPGPRSMGQELPLPPQRDRGSGPTWDRLVVRACGLALVGREGELFNKQAGFDRPLGKRVVGLVEHVDTVFEPGRAVVVPHTYRLVTLHPRDRPHLDGVVAKAGKLNWANSMLWAAVSSGCQSASGKPVHAPLVRF